MARTQQTRWHQMLHFNAIWPWWSERHADTSVHEFFHTSTKKGIAGRARDEIMTQSPQGCARRWGSVILKGAAPCLEATEPVDGAWGSFWISRATTEAQLFTAHSSRVHPLQSQKGCFCTTIKRWLNVWTMCASLKPSRDARINKSSNMYYKK